jgi:hypothetical protein
MALLRATQALNLARAVGLDVAPCKRGHCPGFAPKVMLTGALQVDHFHRAPDGVGQCACRCDPCQRRKSIIYATSSSGAPRVALALRTAWWRAWLAYENLGHRWWVWRLRRRLTRGRMIFAPKARRSGASHPVVLVVSPADDFKSVKH